MRRGPVAFLAPRQMANMGQLASLALRLLDGVESKR